jgi:hypothetical protein
MNHSKLLINESPLLVLPSLAVALGLNEAIVLQQIQFWLGRDGGVEHEGRRWVWNSVAQWSKQFPWWSDNTIQRTLQRLRDAGILEAKALSSDPFNRTLFYTINYSKLEELTTPTCTNGIAPTCGNELPQPGVLLKTETTTETTTEITAESESAREGGASLGYSQESEIDAFTPEELYNEPLPPPPSKRQQASHAAHQEAQRRAIMQSYRAARFGNTAFADPSPAEFRAMKPWADMLIEGGATPAQVFEATQAALARPGDPMYITLRYVAERFTELLAPAPPRVLPKTRLQLRREATGAARIDQALEAMPELAGTGFSNARSRFV